MKDLHSNIDVVSVLDPIAVSATATYTDIDLQGFNSCELVIAVVVPAEGAPAEADLKGSVMEFGAERLSSSHRPRDVVVVYVPEYVVSHWWERLLHNQTALWLKSRLLFTPGVVIASVPFQLHHDDRLEAPVPLPAPVDVRPRVARHGR